MLFDANDHRGVLTCSGCAPAPLKVDAEGASATGLTIRDSKFGNNVHNVIEEHVIVGKPGSGTAIALLSDKGSIVRHNTLVQGACAWNWRCGIVDIDHKDSDPASTGTIVRDNILAEIRSRGASFTAHHNLTTGTQTPS